jgi:hypothetical protein
MTTMIITITIIRPVRTMDTSWSWATKSFTPSGYTMTIPAS